MTSRSPALAPRAVAGDRACASKPAWAWPVDLARYDRSSALTPAERAALAVLGDEASGWWWWWFRPQRADARRRAARLALEHLLLPLRAARHALDLPTRSHAVAADVAVGILLRQCGREGQSFWGWSRATWVHVLGTSNRAFVAAHPGSRGNGVRHCAIAIAYLLRCCTTLDDLGRYRRYVLASKISGCEQMAATLAIVEEDNEPQVASNSSCTFIARARSDASVNAS